jgi:hypothetical protein
MRHATRATRPAADGRGIARVVELEHRSTDVSSVGIVPPGQKPFDVVAVDRYAASEWVPLDWLEPPLERDSRSRWVPSP